MVENFSYLLSKGKVGVGRKEGGLAEKLFPHLNQESMHYAKYQKQRN